MQEDTEKKTDLVKIKKIISSLTMTNEIVEGTRIRITCGNILHAMYRKTTTCSNENLNLSTLSVVS